MTFAYPLPAWAIILIAAAIVALSSWAYIGTSAVLTGRQRSLLGLLRGFTLSALVVFLMRPVAPLPPGPGEHGIVALLVDTSRSMTLRDADGESRFARAVAVARDRLLPDLARGFAIESYGVGERLTRMQLERMQPAARRSELAQAIADVRERFRGRPLAGIVLVSDGGETRDAPADSGPGPVSRSPVPVVTVGVGSASIAFDREVRSVTVGPSALEAGLVDLTATLVGHGAAGATTVRLLQGDRTLEVRDVTLPPDGSPVQQTFTVPPARGAPSTFRVALAEDVRELTTANNVGDVLVPAPGRPRRVLMIEGMPATEHAFLKRAWHEDPSIQVDAAVRKGRNDEGQDTYYVQADPTRAAALTTGFPVTREALFAYDALVFADAQFDQLTRDQLAMAAAFADERGGGILVSGDESLASPALAGSALAAVLPLDLSDRRGAVGHSTADTRVEPLHVAPTPEGLRHPIMRLTDSPATTEQRWAALAPLAGAAIVGGPRAGAAVLAITETSTGATVPLVAVQRYGSGRSMIFGGEGSWHWKMMMPADDRTYDTFWRQALRWLVAESRDPVSLTVPRSSAAGSPVPIDLQVRDDGFAPVAGADTRVTVRGPSGVTGEVPVTADPTRPGHYRGEWLAGEAGIFHFDADARRGTSALGAASADLLVGGIDAEFTDPRLNEPLLRRLAAGSGGSYVPIRQVDAVGRLLRAGLAATAPRAFRDLWHTGWSLTAVVALLSLEWILRRRWGMR